MVNCRLGVVTRSILKREAGDFTVGKSRQGRVRGISARINERQSRRRKAPKVSRLDPAETALTYLSIKTKLQVGTMGLVHRTDTSTEG